LIQHIKPDPENYTATQVMPFRLTSHPEKYDNYLWRIMVRGEIFLLKIYCEKIICRALLKKYFCETVVKDLHTGEELLLDN
jgi:hypothetical protein